MAEKQERSKVVRITFDVIQPDGQLKTVAINTGGPTNWSDTAVIAISDSFIRDQLLPALGEKGVLKSEDALAKWENGEEGDMFLPAMLVVKDDGTIHPKCGAHRSTGHDPANLPVSMYMEMKEE